MANLAGGTCSILMECSQLGLLCAGMSRVRIKTLSRECWSYLEQIDAAHHSNNFSSLQGPQYFSSTQENYHLDSQAWEKIEG